MMLPKIPSNVKGTSFQIAIKPWPEIGLLLVMCQTSKHGFRCFTRCVIISVLISVGWEFEIGTFLEKWTNYSEMNCAIANSTFCTSWECRALF